MNLSKEFKEKVTEWVLKSRENYSGSDASFAKKIGISPSLFSRMKNGETDKLLADSVWLELGRVHNVTMRQNNWKVAKTSVYRQLESNLTFCKENSRSMILIDDCGIGKTYCSKHIISGMKDSFHIDCSQAKSRQQFIRLVAKTLGVDNKGRYIDVKSRLKYYINNVLSDPLIVLDDAGYLDYPTFLEIQELWNATEDACAWYMIGDDSLQQKINRGINSKKIGYKAIFSRFLDEYIHITPVGIDDQNSFLKELFSDVARVNLKDKNKLNPLIKKCMGKESRLRYLKNIIQVNQ